MGGSWGLGEAGSGFMKFDKVLESCCSFYDCDDNGSMAFYEAPKEVCIYAAETLQILNLWIQKKHNP